MLNSSQKIYAIRKAVDDAQDDAIRNATIEFIEKIIDAGKPSGPAIRETTSDGSLRESWSRVSSGMDGGEKVMTAQCGLQPAPLFSELNTMRLDGKIPAIKAYRVRTGLGLKESKEAIEAAARMAGHVPVYLANTLKDSIVGLNRDLAELVSLIDRRRDRGEICLALHEQDMLDRIRVEANNCKPIDIHSV